MHAPVFWICVCECVCMSHIGVYVWWYIYPHQESVSLVAAILGYQLCCCCCCCCFIVVTAVSAAVVVVVATAAVAIESTFIHKSTSTHARSVARFNTQQIETKIQWIKKKIYNEITTNKNQPATTTEKYERNTGFTFVYTSQN